MRDFTRGPILGPLLAFAGPIIAGNLLQISYNLVDTFFVGRLGGDALAAVSVSSVLFVFLLSFSWGLSSAATTLISQYFGAGRRDQLGHVSANLLLLFTVVSSAAAALTLLFHRPVLRWLGTPPAVEADAALYLIINVVALPAFYIFVVVGAILRGIGDSVNPLKISLVANGINVALDPLLIFGAGPVPAMGVAGAAWATTLSRVVAVLWGLLLLQQPTNPTRIRREHLRVDPALLMTAVRIGVPAGGANLLNSTGGMLLMRLVTPFGPDPVAAHGVGLRIESVAVLPAVAMGMAASAWAGQNIGASQPQRAMHGVLWALGLTFLALLVIGGVTAAAAFPLVSIFAPGEEGVVAYGIRYLRILAFSWPFFGSVIVIGQTLRGAGDTIANFIIALANLVLLRLPAAYIFSRIAGWEAVGVWVGVLVSDICIALIAFAYLRSGRWLQRSVVGSDLLAPTPAADVAID